MSRAGRKLSFSYCQFAKAHFSQIKTIKSPFTRPEVGYLFRGVLGFTLRVFRGQMTRKGNHTCRLFFSRSFKRASHRISCVASVLETQV